MPKIEFLCHVVEEGKLYWSIFKTTAVINYPEPKSTKDVQQYLGPTAYFRKCLPSYSTIMWPLTDLLHMDVPFEFDKKERTAFQFLKNLLCGKPCLQIYRQNAETLIHTDASIDSSAGILMQR